MRRSGVIKFPNSVQLFKFCQKVLSDQKGGKVHDQEVGGILNFNPSDCSHWKRGEKSVKSVFALAKLADELKVEISLIHEIASGHANLEDAYFEYQENRGFRDVFRQTAALDQSKIAEIMQSVDQLIKKLHANAEFFTPPLYLPEVLKFFPFLTLQPTEMLDRLSRILRKKPSLYVIHFKKGELKSQTRMSMTKDLAKIIFQGERERFDELLPLDKDFVAFEEAYFTLNLLAPKAMLLEELAKIDSRKDVIQELSNLFWVPKSLICFQLQDLVKTGVAESELYQPATKKTPSVEVPRNVDSSSL